MSVKLKFHLEADYTVELVDNGESYQLSYDRRYLADGASNPANLVFTGDGAELHYVDRSKMGRVVLPDGSETRVRLVESGDEIVTVTPQN